MAYTLFTEPHHFLYRKQFKNAELYIRSINPSQDLELIFQWVNAPYAHYWQMQGTIDDLKKYYLKQKEENITSTFFVCSDQSPIAMFEVYQVMWTELRTYFEAQQGDYGIHLLMAPHRELVILNKQIGCLSEKTLSSIIEMLFSFASVERIIAEPDFRNKPAHKLAEKVGFIFQKKICLSDKIAHLYVITKSLYQKNTQK